LIFISLGPCPFKSGLIVEIVKDFIRLFYPKLCAICQNQLVTNEMVLCAFCRHDLPLIYYPDYKKNKISRTFSGKIIIEKAMSLLIYRREGRTKELIHQLKYKGNQEIGTFLGDWFGEILKENKEFSTVHCIIPVPLHKKKLKIRGFNQLTRFGERLSSHLQIPYIENVLIKSTSTKTQTVKNRLDRFQNAKTKFQLTNTSLLENSHVLLIDDVITTGATLESCCNELLKTKNIKISVASMAFTE
jgi:ComF family protein